MRERYYGVFKIRGLLLIPPAAFCLLCTWQEVETNHLIWPLGGTVFVAGLLLRIWSQMHLHYRLKEHKKLTTTGPYAVVRNPIYIGNSLLLAGFCITSELLWFLPLLLGYCAVTYSLVVRYEEAHLANKYGDAYRDYQHAVPRWCPRFRTTQDESGRRAKRFLWPSVLAEVHCLVLLALSLLKELLTSH